MVLSVELGCLPCLQPSWVTLVRPHGEQVEMGDSRWAMCSSVIGDPDATRVH